MTSHYRSVNLDERAVLDSSILPPNEPVDLTAEPRTIFLTGVTGFVGAFLLHELLEQTQADIYCLVRAKDLKHAEQRIHDNLVGYNLWRGEYQYRILPLIGDLKLPLFGLSPDTFQMLAETVDVVYHCGSKLSYVAPYEHLEAANVGGTQEALRLATQGKAKPFHFVSSLGILLAYRELVGGQEDDELDATKCPDVGYFQTKYVAEKLVRLARDRGIPVTIHRIGLIVGDSDNGVSNPDDFVARMLVGSIKAGYAPNVRNPMDMTPVNFVAQAMVYLSRQQSSLGKVFHLLNPQPIHWSDIFDMVIEAGYPVMKLPFADWIDSLDRYADPDTNPLYPLRPFFHINFARRMLGISDSAFHALGTAQTQEALAGSGMYCTPVDRKLINLFLAQFIRKGYLEQPAIMTNVSSYDWIGVSVPG